MTKPNKQASEGPKGSRGSAMVYAGYTWNAIYKLIAGWNEPDCEATRRFMEGQGVGSLADCRAAWGCLRDDIMGAWCDDPGHLGWRPWAWWMFTAPQPYRGSVPARADQPFFLRLMVDEGLLELQPAEVAAIDKVIASAIVRVPVQESQGS